MAYYYKRTDELYHHGIKGQKWGVRRFQNSDGSLIPAGKDRYSNEKKLPLLSKNIEMSVHKVNKLGRPGQEYDSYELITKPIDVISSDGSKDKVTFIARSLTKTAPQAVQNQMKSMISNWSIHDKILKTTAEKHWNEEFGDVEVMSPLKNPVIEFFQGNKLYNPGDMALIWYKSEPALLGDYDIKNKKMEWYFG